MPILNWKGPEAARIVQEAAQDAIGAAGVIVQRRARQLTGKQGSGRSYKRYTPAGKFSRWHRASAAGHPPALDYGHLNRSIQVSTARLRTSVPMVTVGTRLKYAKYLELGMGIKKRPWLKRALRESKPEIDSMVVRVVSNALTNLRGLI